MSLETPLHKVQGLGSAHSGVSHFWRQRVTGAALVPLAIWFAVCAFGLIGANAPATLSFLQHPLNAILTGAFVLVASYHMALGLQVVIEDYIHNPGIKLFLMLIMRAFCWIIAIISVVALLRIVIS